MLLQDDVKPVIIKRIINQFLEPATHAKPGWASGNDQPFSCDLSVYPDVPQLDGESNWSMRDNGDKMARMKSRLAEHHLDQPGPMKDIQLIYYEKTIVLLKSHSIDVVLTLNPELPEFLRLKNPEGQKIHRRFIEEMAQKYHLRILDMSGLSHYGERLFQDQDHVDAPSGWLLGRSITQDFCNHEITKDSTVQN